MTVLGIDTDALTTSSSLNSKSVSMRSKRFLAWVRLILLVLVFSLFMLQLQGCSSHTMSQAEVDRLTQPEPDSVRQRAIRRIALASAYFAQDQMEAAMQETRAALQIDPDFAQAYSLLGLIHQRNNAMDLAKQSFETAIRLTARVATSGDEIGAVLHNYGWFLCQQGKYASAQYQFAMAISQPGYRQLGQTWLVNGVCQVRAKQPVQARNSFEKALGFAPNDPTARFELALLDWQDGNAAQARRMLGDINTSQQASSASLWLGVLVARALKLDSEMNTLGERLVQRFANSPQTALWLARKFDDK
jgi:type IV pilus assembly protein PilF